MNEHKLREMLTEVASGGITADAALEALRGLPFEDIGFAKIDFHRSLRKGHPEAIFCEGKTAEQVAAIAERMHARGENVLGTRCGADAFAAVHARVAQAEYHEIARCLTITSNPVPPSQGYVAVVCAGTSDVPVAEEAVVTCQAFGSRVERVYDVGVAGIHRLFEQRDRLTEARVVIVCAGMEGALPSVVAGLIPSLVIAVPTSVGYGASFRGLAALLGMLNSCATGLTVVNIDNGFGAAVAACVINAMVDGNNRNA